MKIVVFLAFLASAGPTAALADNLRGDMAYVAKDYATAYREWSAAATAGDPAAMAAIGTLFDTGHGVPQDFGSALEWYRRAAEAGSTRGMFNVGAMYDNGRGTPVDRQAAIQWYTMAANEGHGRAAFALGLIYRNGDGVARDPAQAVRFFQIAAGAGIVAARSNLAQMRAPAPPAALATLAPRAPAPRPTPNADAEAARIQQAVLSRAALGQQEVGTFVAMVKRPVEQAGGEGPLAQYNAAFAFEYGYGQPQDALRSYVYYLRATTSPDQRIRVAATRGAADVGKRLTEAQHTVARDMLLDGSR